jgi:hypothetical protein
MAIEVPAELAHKGVTEETYLKMQRWGWVAGGRPVEWSHWNRPQNYREDR